MNIFALTSGLLAQPVPLPFPKEWVDKYLDEVRHG